jgi:hypothetical protein
MKKGNILRVIVLKKGFVRLSLCCVLHYNSIIRYKQYSITFKLVVEAKEYWCLSLWENKCKDCHFIFCQNNKISSIDTH